MVFKGTSLVIRHNGKILMKIKSKNIVGVLLAGGLARRMGGGDKCLKLLGGRTLLSYTIDVASDQVGQMIINAAGNSSRFEKFNLPVVSDVVVGSKGPLAGVLTGMEWAAQNVPNCDLIATFPTDAPFFPSDLVNKLLHVLYINDADIACARSNLRTHPVFAIWPIKLAEDLREAIIVNNLRKIDEWTSRYKVTYVDWPTKPFDPFFNINRPEDLEQAEEYIN